MQKTYPYEEHCKKHPKHNYFNDLLVDYRHTANVILESYIKGAKEFIFSWEYAEDTFTYFNSEWCSGGHRWVVYSKDDVIYFDKTHDTDGILNKADS
jgi:hypothetical protein